MAMALSLIACNDDKKQEKALQMSVMDIHEKVMADDEKAMIAKMKLDTLIAQAKIAKADTVRLHSYSAGLTEASDKMGTWMSNFKADYTGMNHTDIMMYLTGQQAVVKHIDSLYISATNRATAYLDSIKRK